MEQDNNTLFSQLEKPIGITNDHAGYEMKIYLTSILREKGIKYIDFGSNSTESVDYPDFAHPMALAIEHGECYPGISICGTGNGINMVMNKHQGIRSALCWNEEIARLARAHNDANALALPGRFVSEEEAYRIVVAFLTTPFDGGRHLNRINKIPCGPVEE